MCSKAKGKRKEKDLYLIKIHFELRVVHLVPILKVETYSCCYFSTLFEIR